MRYILLQVDRGSENLKRLKMAFSLARLPDFLLNAGFLSKNATFLQSFFIIVSLRLETLTLEANFLFSSVILQQFFMFVSHYRDDLDLRGQFLVFVSHFTTIFYVCQPLQIEIKNSKFKNVWRSETNYSCVSESFYHEFLCLAVIIRQILQSKEKDSKEFEKNVSRLQKTTNDCWRKMKESIF